jgi:uncharacterized membrane protein YhaH (DUF805 family)
MSWYLKCLRQYADVSGRARRKEFWMFVLFNLLIVVALRIVDHATGLTYGRHGGQGFLHSFYTLVVFIPGVAVAVRRMHDIGKSGWHLLVAFIPLVGAFVLLYWYAKDGDPGANAYGANPKAAGNA